MATVLQELTLFYSLFLLLAFFRNTYKLLFSFLNYVNEVLALRHLQTATYALSLSLPVYAF